MNVIEPFDLDAAFSEPIEYSAYESVTLAEGEIDPRLKLLSHSSRTTLHKCPRRYQLYRLSSEQISLSDEKEVEQGVTFSYGHAVGTGIQSVLEGKSINQVYLDVFLAWDSNLLDSNPKKKKSIWEALFAIEKFISLRTEGYLRDYELVYYKGLPAVELSFRILLPDGFQYRGFVDVVLRNTLTEEVVVLELKTTGNTPVSAVYKNSGQALGYSIVLDIMFPGISSYQVLYLVYYSGGREFTEFYFEKSPLQRALWLQDLLIESDRVKLYEKYGSYPMHGESCYDFFRECEYLGLCSLDIARLTKPLTLAVLNKIAEEKYMFDVDFYNLVEAQIKKEGG